MIRNKFLNNRKATKNSLALTTALCLSMGTLIGNSTFAMELQDDNLQGAHSTLRPKSFSQSNNRNITAEQLRKDLERSSASVPADLKHYLEESNRNNKLNFCQDPETDFIQIENNSIFILSGNIVGMSDLKKNIAQQPNISIFCVYSEYFSFDEDIETPGATLFIDASHWSVKGKRMINLSGEQGRDHRRKKASNGNNPGADGTNGSPGSCGENGGHFYGRGLSFENLENLTINVSGGRGGKGQDGGDGADGADGENGKKSNFENAGEDNFLVNLENLKPGDLAYGNYKSDTYEMVESGYVKYDSKGPYGMVEPGDLAYGSKGERIAKKICTDNEKYRELYQSGERGKAGGNAGAGGEGGKSGQKGSIIINGDGYQAIATEKNGTDGSPGSPGLGGKDGTVWQRTRRCWSVPTDRRGEGH